MCEYENVKMLVRRSVGRTLKLISRCAYLLFLSYYVAQKIAWVKNICSFVSLLSLLNSLPAEGAVT
jgi:hypothetical protein